MTGSAPIHLRPATSVAERVLLPGDPGRALAVAQALLEPPAMMNHARGLWGYTGTAADGELLTVQSTGMGGPSAAIVVEELVGLGARTFVRIGTCGALRDGFELGELVSAREVIGTDGASAALGAPARQLPDPKLAGALEREGAQPATVLSTDLFYDPRPDAPGGSEGADVVEMEAAALLAVAARRRARAAVLLAVSDQLAGGERRRIAREELEAVGVRLGELAFAALAN